MPLFGSSKHRRLIEEAAERAGRRADSLSNPLTRSWVFAAAGTCAGLAVSLLKHGEYRQYQKTMTPVGAERLLAVLTAVMAENFVQNDDNLALIERFQAGAPTNFQNDVLSCLDEYGLTFLRVTERRAARNPNAGTAWAVALSQHIHIAVGAPEETRAFSSAAEAGAAGLAIGDSWGDALAAFTLIHETYRTVFIPSLTSALRGDGRGWPVILERR